LVTGAAAGIGRATSLRLASEGFAIGVLDLNLEGCEKVVAEIEAAGGKALAIGASIVDRAAVTAGVDALRAAFGPVTVLVNNAGITGFKAFVDITDEDWDLILAINVKGIAIVTQVVLPDMVAAKWGRIINLSSSSAQSGAPGMAHYAASKGGVIALTRTLALELGPDGITVNNVSPGAIMGTIMSEANLDKFPIPRDVLLKSLPVRRTGEPEDIANAVSWLANDMTSYVTGQTISVSGGRIIT
jgi:2-hydroxycyclohexanecarboxyl-CoA dehydrogenase